MAFRQRSRKTLARSVSNFHGRSRIAVFHQFAQIEHNGGFAFERHLHRPWHFCRCSGRFQRKSSATPRRQLAVGTINALASLAGFAGPYTFGYSPSRNRIFRHRIRGVDVLCSCNGNSYVIHAAASPRDARICKIELNAVGQMQLRFDLVQLFARAFVPSSTVSARSSGCGSSKSSN